MLIFGAGFLGGRLAGALPGAVLSRADITRPDEVRAAIAGSRASVVINAAAATGRPNVDALEAEPLRTARSNTLGPLVVAEACAEAGAWMLQLGSGCVFYGPSPAPGAWRELDPANPVSLYARTKYAADLALGDLPGVCVLRLRMPIDDVPGPRNLITKVAGYPQVLDAENSVTVVADLLEVIAGLVRLRPSGVLHATNPGTLTHRHLIARYQALVDPNHTCTFVDEATLLEQGLILKRRSNAILDTQRLESLGLHMRPIHEALDDALRRYASSFASFRGATAP